MTQATAPATSPSSPASPAAPKDSRTAQRSLGRRLPARGRRQCVAIARSVYFGACVLILDEPTAALKHELAQVRGVDVEGLPEEEDPTAP
ncbi:hypothetical protein [Streptomyces himalayensis]|uniref:hypothetical protein n=1 Tax=Streptomyces himalayensis TaxID=2820085 RepID=UPI00215D8ABF|nr:hypothetical protein [Streptomyces himalayensis]